MTVVGDAIFWQQKPHWAGVRLTFWFHGGHNDQAGQGIALRRRHWMAMKALRVFRVWIPTLLLLLAGCSSGSTTTGGMDARADAAAPDTSDSGFDLFDTSSAVDLATDLADTLDVEQSIDKQTADQAFEEVRPNDVQQPDADDLDLSSPDLQDQNSPADTVPDAPLPDQTGDMPELDLSDSELPLPDTSDLATDLATDLFGDLDPADTNDTVDHDLSDQSTPDAPDLLTLCKPKSGTPITCNDLLEQELLTRWSYFAQNGEPTTLSATATSLSGTTALRVDTQAAFAFHVRYQSPTVIDASSKNRLHFLLRAFNDNEFGWQGNFPIVRLEDQNGVKQSYTPTSQLMPSNGNGWVAIDVPLAGGNGWTISSSGSLDLSKIVAIEVAVDTWGAGFWFVLDGMSFVDPGQTCAIDCPDNCNGRGTCDAALLGCQCELGALGGACESCAAGWKLVNGKCALENDADYDYWPNPISRSNSDPWLMTHHQKVKLLRPKVLVLHFVNESTPTQTKTLIDKIFAGFLEGSRSRGYLGPQSPAQLELQIAKIVDLRNGENGNPTKPVDWPFRNSTLYPRKQDNGNWVLDYAQFFGPEFARLYGYVDPQDSKRYLTLCELIESGIIHEVWMVGAHTDKDAPAAEVLEYKHRYNLQGTPLPGQFDRCAGNGCFADDVPHCNASVKIGFVNFERGPGCYLHSIGHGLEWSGTRDIVPPLQKWFAGFAGFDLDKRYGLPFSSLYALSCSGSNCISYDGKKATFTHNNSPQVVDNWDGRCGNVHFPPNGTEHYDYVNTAPLVASCLNFGRPDADDLLLGICDDYGLSSISRNAWLQYETLSPDCGGAFLVWWYQNMPGHDSGQINRDGTPMLSVWPFLYY